MARSTLSSGWAEGSAVEEKRRQEVERYLLHEIGEYLEPNRANPHEEVLCAPQSPARDAIRSARLQRGLDLLGQRDASIGGVAVDINLDCMG